MVLITLPSIIDKNPVIESLCHLKHAPRLRIDMSNYNPYERKWFGVTRKPTFALFDFLLTVKAAPHECVIRTGKP